MNRIQQKQGGVELSLNARQAISEVEIASGKIPLFGLDLISMVDSGKLTISEAIKLVDKEYSDA